MPEAASGPTPFDIFLSYDRADRAIADRLREALQIRNVTVWLDTDQISAGERWGRRLQEGLEASRMFCVIATQRSAKSRWVETEYLAALVLAHSSRPSLRLTALLFEHVKLPLILQTFQAVDFQTTFDEAVEALVRGALMARADLVQKAAAGTSMPELNSLQQSLKSERETRHRLMLARRVSPTVGLAAVSAVTFAGLLPFEMETMGVLITATAVTGLFGWGATLPFLTASRQRTKRFEFLFEKLPACDGSEAPDCREYRLEFWRTLQGRATAR